MNSVSKYNPLFLLSGFLIVQIIFLVFSNFLGRSLQNLSLLPFLVILCALQQNWVGLCACVVFGFLLDIFSFATFGTFLFKSSFLFFLASLWLSFFFNLSLYVLLTFLVIVEKMFLDKLVIFLLNWGKEPFFRDLPFLALILDLVIGYLLLFLFVRETNIEER